jgi:hypothetical protein
MSELYLIAHKVRGEPALDIAIKMGDWWIIPTSGHRAYPYWHGDLEQLFHFGPFNLPEMPEGIPDHYPMAKKAPTNLDDLEIE